MSIASRWCSLRLAIFVIGGLLLLGSAGCTSLSEYVSNGFKVGPNYQKPPAPVADEWIDSKTKGVNIATKDLREWWSVFNDPALNSLIENAYRQNLDVRTAGTRILAARAQRNIAAGNLFPQLQEAFADVSRNAISGNRANVPPGVSRFFDNNAVGLNLSWELDFWGRFRRGIEAADAELDATIENYDDALVLLISEVATNYVQMRVFQQRLKYAVGDGQAVIEEGSRLNPDLIILDITLPILNGIDAARQLRTDGFKGKIIFLTVHHDQDYVEAAHAAGAQGYVVKSQLASDLIPAIQAIMAGAPFISPVFHEAL